MTSEHFASEQVHCVRIPDSACCSRHIVHPVMHPLWDNLDNPPDTLIERHSMIVHFFAVPLSDCLIVWAYCGKCRAFYFDNRRSWQGCTVHRSLVPLDSRPDPA